MLPASLELHKSQSHIRDSGSSHSKPIIDNVSVDNFVTKGEGEFKHRYSVC